MTLPPLDGAALLRLARALVIHSGDEALRSATSSLDDVHIPDGTLGQILPARPTIDTCDLWEVVLTALAELRDLEDGLADSWGTYSLSWESAHTMLENNLADAVDELLGV